MNSESIKRSIEQIFKSDPELAKELEAKIREKIKEMQAN